MEHALCTMHKVMCVWIVDVREQKKIETALLKMVVVRWWRSGGDGWTVLWKECMERHTVSEYGMWSENKWDSGW